MNQADLFPVDLKTALVRALECGAANGKHEAELVAELGHNGRAIRKAITELRLEGVLVCGNPKDGYFIAKSPEEVRKTYDFLRSRAMHSLRVINRFKRGLLELTGQRRLKT
jgi:biotin operon repressor